MGELWDGDGDTEVYDDELGREICMVVRSESERERERIRERDSQA
jgi:hypothetical protein